MENKNKHLEFIQAVVTRLASNSFLIKGWSVSLITALFALAAAGAKADYVLLAYLPAVVFWGLDGYFLQQERLFRGLYDAVRVLEEKNIDFGMSTANVQNKGWLNAVFSQTLFFFHGVILAAIVVVTLVSYGKL